ncbi:MAG TPA: phytoene/squalene synthase family protein [Ignavibacteria bacterium]|nr:phytoene/squalene synthase family protein [Ignavibacteria bacterium]
MGFFKNDMVEEKEITAQSKTNFLYSFSFLSKEKNEAINTVYAFCRKTDDIVDDEKSTTDVKYKLLREWKNEFEKAMVSSSKFSLLNKVNEIRKKFNIPVEPFFELMKGMEMDIQKNRYKNFEELYNYCYCAAATVGLMCIEIFGYRNIKTKEFAVNLGIALQLTNILRDLKKDAENGRIYLPKEDLEKFGYSEEDLLKNNYNNSFIELMKFECERARRYYKKANECLSKEDKGLMFAARIMEKIYFGILEKIEKVNYNVFDNAAKVSKFKKIFITLGVFAKYRLLYSFKDPRPVFND